MEEHSLSAFTIAIETLANEKKEKGNEMYKNCRYSEALKFYDEALALDPTNSAYFGNKSACCMMLNMFDIARDAAKSSIRFNKYYEKGHLRNLRCNILMGDTKEADIAYKTALELGFVDENNSTNEFTIEKNKLEMLKLNMDQCIECFKAKHYTKALVVIGNALSYAKGSSSLKLMHIEALIHLNRNSDAERLLNHMLLYNKTNVDLIYTKALSHYYSDKIDDAITTLQTALKLNPGHFKSMELNTLAKQLRFHRSAGNTEFYCKRYLKAKEYYTTALSVDPSNDMVNSKLYCNRATSSFQLNQMEACITDCCNSLLLNGNNIKALHRRAMAYIAMENFQFAINDYERIYQLSPTTEHKTMLQNARARATSKCAVNKEPPPPDYYTVLGININATKEDIKKAYKKRALDLHPDRHANASEHIKKEQEKKFKELGEAYKVLSDPVKKCGYDSEHNFNNASGFNPHQNPYHVFQGSGLFFSSSQGRCPYRSRPFNSRQFN